MANNYTLGITIMWQTLSLKPFISEVSKNDLTTRGEFREVYGFKPQSEFPLSRNL